MKIDLRAGESLAEALRERGEMLPLPCGGQGRCGKCLVHVRGEVEAPDAAELRLLNAASAPPEGFAARLACRCRGRGGEAEILLPRDYAQGAPLAAAHAQALPAYDGDAKDALGVAVDIGTTTVTLLLYDLPSGRLLALEHALNAQSSYGADVLSRIEAAKQHRAALHEAITGQLSGLLSAALARAGAERETIARVVITANTTMLHFLTDLDASGIGVSPYVPVSLFGDVRPASTVFPGLDAELYIPPCISAYVGADVVCGMAALGFGAEDGHLLVDIGTNGEMALYAGGRVLCCATAAGPALEGGNISMGMPAIDGAVYSISEQGEALTIGGGAPKGFCGSGLLSAVRYLLEQGILEESGRLPGEYHDFGGGLRLTREDIRNVQLAKAAIAAGLETLVHEAGLREDEVAALHLGGGFGSYLNVEDAAAIGLLPEGLAARAKAAGNTALSGAAALLFSRDERKKIQRLAEISAETPLNTNAYFMDRYVENMAFPEV